MNVNRIVWFFLLFIPALCFATPARAQTENMSGLLEEDEGLNPDELLQDPAQELFSEGLQESTAIEGLLSQEELDAIKNGGAKVPPVENGGAEPRILPSGESKSAVTPQALSLPSGEASISGMGESFQPLLTTGAASMSIPIALPPGRAGVQPSLAFSYLSTAGNGTMGIGWIVSVPFIARQTDKGMPYYGERGLSNWRSGVLDRFIYNGGEEIVPVASPSETADCRMEIDYEIPYYDVATGEVNDEAVEKFPDEVCGWWYFRTRLEGAFLRFFWNPDRNLWVVQDKNGTLMYFGPTVGTGSDRGMLVEADGGRKTFQWNLTKIKDVHGIYGNTIYYQYERDGGHSYLRHIWYNSLVTGEDQSPQDGCGSPGDFTCYGHHIELQYEERPDPIVSYGSGYRIDTNWRLIRVTVESRDLYSGDWVHTRDYDVTYDTESYWSQVESIQLFGRNRADNLPAMVFEYTQVDAKTVDGGRDTEIPGFGGIDGTLKEFAWSPPHSVDEGMTDLFDANHDGFADVLVTDMARYDHGHGLFINICDSSGTCSFTETDYPVKMWGGLPVGADFDLANTNLNPLDIDSDGMVEFLHMPHLRDYKYFRIIQEPEREGMDSLTSGYYWEQRGPFPTSGVDPDLDFTRDAAEIRLVDLNNDHMVDVLRTTGTRMEHWLNLGRCEGGEGKFGRPAYNEYGVCTGWTIEPITSCVLYRGLPKKFSDGDLRLADMNGDGMQDIVHIRQGDVAYWAGRGPGLWGDGGDCRAGTYGDDRETVMEGTYYEMRPEVHQVFLSDVNGDGLSDLLQVRFDAVDIWINVGGYEFMPRHIIDRTPAHPGFTDRVRFADVDGTGTPDLLWGDAGNYRYIDFSGGIRSRMLHVVDNGLGKVTSIDYQPSTVDYVRDMESDRTPTSVSPMPSMVVSRVTVSDSLGWEKVTEYYYHDGYYDGCEAEFRGYQEAEVREIGDANSPTSWSRSHFHVGARPSDTQCLDDNPLEGLKGQPAWTETFDEAGVYLKTDWSSYRVRKLYDGYDGRDIFLTYSDENGAFVFDTSRFIAAPEGYCEARPAVGMEDSGSITTETMCVPRRSETGGEIRNMVMLDELGEQVYQGAFGRTDWEGDDVVQRSMRGLVGTWQNREVESWTEGKPEVDAAEKLRWLKNRYDERGDLMETWGRFDFPVEAGSPESGWAIVGGQWYLLSAMDYLGSGLGRDGYEGMDPSDSTSYKRHVHYGYEPSYGTYLVSEATEVSPGRYLEISAEWDGGFGAITAYRGYNGDEARYILDPLGRIEGVYLPGCQEPSTVYAYETGLPLSTVLVRRNQSCQDEASGAIEEPGAEAGSEGFVQVLFVDGLARPRGKVSEGDGPGEWIVENHVVFDAKGGAWGTYLPYTISALMDFDAGAARQRLINRYTYDAFGRTLRIYSPDGEDFTGFSYGLFSKDTYKKAHLVPGVYFGAYRTELYDGQTRLIRSVERSKREDGSVDLLATTYVYDTLGGVMHVQEGKLAGDEWSDYEGFVYEVESWYDSNGGEMVRRDQDRGTIYYIFNEIGDLVRYQDGRGVTSAYRYDMGGRLVEEDYSDDGAIDVRYGFDEPYSGAWYTETVVCHRSGEAGDCPKPQRNLLGRLSWVEARSGTRIWSYEDKGLIEWIDTQLSSHEAAWNPETCGEGAVWERRNDTTQIWHVETGYDEMQQIVWEDFPEEGSRAHYAYYDRGLLKSITLERPSWEAGSPVVSRIDYDAQGKIRSIEYNDAAQTQVAYGYDAMQRLARLLTHMRGYRPEDGGDPEDRTLMDYSYRYDVASNLEAILDHRDASLVRGWSSAPVNYYYHYDSLGRLTRATPIYHEPQPGRVGVQEWSFDRLGSQVRWTDPAHRFYGWSLDKIRNGLQLIEDEGLTEVDDRPPAPHALYKAYDIDPTTDRGSFLQAHYDDGGNMTALEVYRGCGECYEETYRCAFPCDSAEKSVFRWDEVGRLQETFKVPGIFNGTDYEFPCSGLTGHEQYTYDAFNRRTVKKLVGQEPGQDRYDLYLNERFEYRGAEAVSTGEGAIELVGGEGIKYVNVQGSRIARVVEEPRELGGGESYVFLYLSNHLRSTQMVVDADTGRLVQSGSYLAYGEADGEKIIQPGYEGFEADYGFSGKEKDAGSGLVYFGERYYMPLLGRWMSADPLGILGPGSETMDAYTYCRNSPLVLLDLFGLDHEAFLQWLQAEKGSGHGYTWNRDEHGININDLSESEKYGKPAKAKITLNKSYGGKTKLKGSYKCNALIGTALEFTRHYTPLNARSKFMQPSNIFKNIKNGIQKHSGQMVELWGKTKPIGGKDVKWGVAVTPEELETRYPGLGLKDPAAAMNKMIEDARADKGALWGVEAASEDSPKGHEFTPVKVLSAEWTGSFWKATVEVEDIYTVGGEEAASYTRTGINVQIIESAMAAEGESTNVFNMRVEPMPAPGGAVE